jgi:hypothetical protein
MLTVAQAREAHADSLRSLTLLSATLHQAMMAKGRAENRARLKAYFARKLVTVIARVAEQKRDAPTGWGEW